MSENTIGLIGYLSRMSLVALVPAMALGIAIVIAAASERRMLVLRVSRGTKEQRAFRDYLYTVGAPALWAVAVTAAFNLAQQNTSGQLLILGLTAVVVIATCAHYSKPEKISLAALAWDASDLAASKYTEPFQVIQLRAQFDDAVAGLSPRLGKSPAGRKLVEGMEFSVGGAELRARLLTMPMRTRVRAIWSRKHFQAWAYTYLLLVVGSTGVLVFNFDERAPHHWVRWILPVILALLCAATVYLIGATQLLLEGQLDLRDKARAKFISENLREVEARLAAQQAEAAGSDHRK